MRYGLIGDKLGHSFSKSLHERLSGIEYTPKELRPEELDAFMMARDFLAINVTAPYKQAVIPYLDEIDESAKEIGAVNTVVNRGGRLYGYNTDFFGMKMLFSHAGINPSGKKTAILGTGGTSRTAMAVLSSLGAKSIIRASRTKRDGAVSYEELYEKHGDTEIIVNTTPLGTYPAVSGCAVDISRFSALLGVIDAVYNPIRTTLILDARSRGIKAEGGLYMLVAQAVRASEIFLDKKYPKGRIDKLYEEIKREKENIVLIGMPSSGKSTVGKILEKKLGRTLVDIDELIVSEAKCEISEIFKVRGEAFFRALEATAIVRVASLSSQIIATGGGAVLNAENLMALKRNGKIFFIDRPLNMLTPTDTRPLASDFDAVVRLFEQRYPIYSSVADERIDASCDAETVADKILEKFL